MYLRRNIVMLDCYAAVTVNLLQTEILSGETNGTALVCIFVEDVVRRTLTFVITPTEDDNARGVYTNNHVLL